MTRHTPPRLKVGVIGCGRVAQSIHLNILLSMAGVEVVALAEPDLQRRGEASRRVPGAPSYASYEHLLKLPDVEAVFICVPTALHAEVALAALEHGKHIYLEKPLATNLDEARSVLTAWRRAGVVGMIGFNYRFNPLFQTVRRHIQSGRLGTLIGIRSVFSTAARPLPLWKQTRQSGGGVLLDLAAHHVDLVHLFFGQEVRQIYAELRSHHSEDDSAALELRLADGLLVQSFFSLCAVEEDRFEIYGQAGKLAVDRYRSLDVEIIEAGREFSLLNRVGRGLRALSRGPYLFKKHFALRNEPSYREAVRQFVSAVRGNAVAAPDLQDGYRCLEVVCAAERSAHTGQTLLLSSSTCGPR